MQPAAEEHDSECELPTSDSKVEYAVKVSNQFKALEEPDEDREQEISLPDFAYDADKVAAFFEGFVGSESAVKELGGFLQWYREQQSAETERRSAESSRRGSRASRDFG